MVKRYWKIIFIILSQLFDVAAIALTKIIVNFIYVGFASFTDPRFYFPLFTFTVVYLAVASMLGLYRGSFHLSLRLQNFIMFRSYLVSVLIANSIILFSGLFYFRMSIAVFFIFLPLVLFFSRFILKQLNLYAQKFGYGIHETLIIGKDGEIEKLFSRFSIFPELGYKIRGLVSTGESLHILDIPQYSFDRLYEITEQFKIDRIFITSDLFRSHELKIVENISKEKGIKTKMISSETENVLNIARIYDIAGITLIYPPSDKAKYIKRISKRTFDLIGAVLITLILSPIFIITAVAIYFESGSPIFFLQRRTSHKNVKGFNFIKFRSMVSNAEQMKAELMGKNESDGALFKIKNDPRVTNVGRLIRKLSIDELPQLFNVIKGEMSLVGPRPLPPSDFENANEPNEFWDAIYERSSVKPGMTGLWQVSGRSNIKFREMILLDLYYVENHTLLFDLEILFETIPVVLLGKGAY